MKTKAHSAEESAAITTAAYDMVEALVRDGQGRFKGLCADCTMKTVAAILVSRVLTMARQDGGEEMVGVALKQILSVSLDLFNLDAKEDGVTDRLSFAVPDEKPTGRVH